jgi:signal peptidase I
VEDRARGHRIAVPVLTLVVALFGLASGVAAWTSGQAFATGRNSTVVFSVPSGAMEPTIKVGAQIVVNERAYAHHAVQRGDIIVFRRPADEDCGGQPVADIVKRVVGLPGEAISLTKGSKGDVLIGGRRIDETWLPSSEQGATFPGPAGTAYDLTRSYRIPAGHYYVMGDNRTDSCDSRYWGPISKSLIVGKVERVLNSSS